MGSVSPPDVGLSIVYTSLQGSFGVAKADSSGAIVCDHAEFQREHRSLSTNVCRAGVRGPRRAPGCTRGVRRDSLGQRGRKVLPPPNRWRGGRKKGVQRTRLRQALLFDFFLIGTRFSNQAGNGYATEDGICFLFFLFRFHFHCFCGDVHCCDFSFIPGTHQNKKRSMHVRACVRRPGY